MLGSFVGKDTARQKAASQTEPRAMAGVTDLYHQADQRGLTAAR